MGGNGVLATCFFGIIWSSIVGGHQQDALQQSAEVEDSPMMLLRCVIFVSEEIG